MTTETYLTVALYALGALLIVWQGMRMWRNVVAQRGTGQAMQALQRWASSAGWSLVDTNVKAPWRKPFEDQSGTTILEPKAVALGAVDGTEWMVAVGKAYDDFDEPGQPSITSNVVYWRFTVKPVGGWVRVRAATSRFRGQIKRTDTESIDFNHDVHVHAYPAKLAYQVLAPDMMDWYLHTSSRPWIHIHDETLLIVFEGTGPEIDIAKQYREVERIIHHIAGLTVLEQPKE